MRYEILGSLPLVGSTGMLRTVGPRKSELLLTTLVIRADQVVPTEHLIRELWGHAPPRKATAALHVYVSQLRKLLAGLGAVDPIRTRQSGYLFSPGDARIDANELLVLVARARVLAKEARHDEVLECLDDALALWRGPMLADLRDGPVINAFATWLEEVRLECFGMIIAANFALASHERLIAFLHSAIAEYPLHEALHEQLMLALYRSQRRADALKVYDRARATLLTELGLPPGRSMRELRETILLAQAHC